MTNNNSLRILADDFVSYKQSIGYTYESPRYYLFRYVIYTEKLSPDIKIPNKQSIDTFLNTLTTVPGTRYSVTAVLREFSRYLSLRGYKEAYIIPPKSSPRLVPEPPYFFSEDEITAFFIACDSIQPYKRYCGREFIFPALFRLLYCCGLRCKEAITLLCTNVHLDDGFLDILQSKGPKSRRIYISDELSKYLKHYDSIINELIPERTYFFPQGNKSCYTGNGVNLNFKQCWKQANPDFELSTRPRTHDFRHHFVWANLNRWATENIDVNIMLPYLIRYMGHQTIKSTLYYFHFVPEFFSSFSDLSKTLEFILPEVPDEKR